jgi:hypothetical protein
LCICLEREREREREIPDALAMGKIGDEYVQQEEQRENDAERSRCSVVLRLFSFKCLFILFFSLSAFLSGIFWILPKHTTVISFDAKDVIKNSGNSSLPFTIFQFRVINLCLRYLITRF